MSRKGLWSRVRQTASPRSDVLQHRQSEMKRQFTLLISRSESALSLSEKSLAAKEQVRTQLFVLRKPQVHHTQQIILPVSSGLNVIRSDATVFRINFANSNRHRDRKCCASRDLQQTLQKKGVHRSAKVQKKLLCSAQKILSIIRGSA